MPQTVPSTLREWSDNLSRPAPPRELFSVFLAMLALTFAGLVGAAGIFHAGILWTGGERLAASNEFALAMITFICGLTAVACATCKSSRSQTFWIIVCVCSGATVTTACFLVHNYFVPEGPGWFGSYGKPNTIWGFAVAAICASTIIAGISRLVLHYDES